MTTTPIAPKALTIKQFLARYNICRTSAWQLARDGKIVTRNVGKRVLIDFDSAERWYMGLPSNEGVEHW